MTQIKNRFVEATDWIWAIQVVLYPQTISRNQRKSLNCAIRNCATARNGQIFLT